MRFETYTAAVALLLLGSAGCTTTLRVSSLQDAKAPTTTINYTSVRGDARRFPDYSGVDRTVLAR